MLYLDTSVLVAALTPEQRTAFMQEWLAKQPGGELAISDWVVTGFSAALSNKLRTRQINAKQRANALSVFTSIVQEIFSRVTISPREFGDAARYADQHKSGLRAGDALHLAVCVRLGTPFFMLDKTLAKAATALGIRSELL